MSGKEIVSYEGVHCANCTTPMQGEYCHDCGQSIHTVLKPVHHMFEDTLETFLHNAPSSASLLTTSSSLQ